MPEMKEPHFARGKENVSSDPYADIQGVPYPELPLSISGATAWMDGQKKIFERMKYQEKEIVTDLKLKFDQVKTQEEFDALVDELTAATSQLGGQTVAIRSFSVTSPSGADYEIAVMFKPRRDIAQKDEVPRFGIMLM